MKSVNRVKMRNHHKNTEGLNWHSQNWHISKKKKIPPMQLIINPIHFLHNQIKFIFNIYDMQGSLEHIVLNNATKFSYLF